MIKDWPKPRSQTMEDSEVSTSRREKGRTASLGRRVWKHADLYLMLVPGLVFLFIFKYMPMWGLQIAFEDFNVFKGIGQGRFIGLANFEKLFRSSEFLQVLRNTLIISGLKIGLLFPCAILSAIMLNEISWTPFKKTTQTLIYLPHFLSWVVVAGLFVSLLSSTGLVNRALNLLGISSVNFLTSNVWFRWIIIFTDGWKETGWDAIVFIAAIAGISQDMYESAMIDGAGRIRRIISITLPSIMPTIVLIFTLRIGKLLEAGTEQVLAMYNPVVYDSVDVIGTYVYRRGLGKMDYSFSTAVDLFNSVIGFALVLLSNGASRRLTGSSIW